MMDGFLTLRTDADGKQRIVVNRSGHPKIEESVAEVNRLLEKIAAKYGPNHPTDAEWLRAPNEQEADDEDTMDYEDWVATQWWPEGATHATMDRQGGVIWWKLKPVLAAAREYGWKPREHGGELVERYYDPAMPFSGPKWRESLRQKPTEEEDAT